MSSTTVAPQGHALKPKAGSDLWRGRCQRTGVSLWTRGTSSVWSGLPWQPCNADSDEAFPQETRTPHRRFCNLVAKQALFEKNERLLMTIIKKRETKTAAAPLPCVTAASVQELLVSYRQRCAGGSGWALEWCWRGTSQRGRMWHRQFRTVWSGNVSHREFSHRLSCRKERVKKRNSENLPSCLVLSWYFWKMCKCYLSFFSVFFKQTQQEQQPQ